MKEIVNEILARLVAPGVVGVIDWYKLVGDNNDALNADKKFIEETNDFAGDENWAIE